jgi:hypothetical protein
MTGRALASLLVLAMALAMLGGCSEVAENEPLPWLRVKKTQHKPIGGFGGGSDTYDYYVRRFGFVWVKLDEAATGEAIVLDPNTAVISTAQGLKILYRGEDQGALACGSQKSTPSVVAKAGVIDCIDVVAGPAERVASQIRWRRISGAGEALVVERLSAEEPDRVFLRPMVSFYDAGHQPYFVTLRADRTRPECALLWTAGGEVHSLRAPEGMTLGQCSDAIAWSRVVRRQLRNV